MAFLGNIKKIFGFSDSDLEREMEESTGKDATVTPLAVRKQREAAVTEPSMHQSALKYNADPIDESEMPQIPSAVPEDIFEAVVKIFNESLPPFLKSSVDEKAQREYIYQTLDESMKQYIRKLAEISDERTRIIWENDRRRLQVEMQSIKEKARKIEESSAEWKEQKLSAERQKRALSQRVQDLEREIDSFQAEKEQYELENKSLVNKIRAMQVDGDSAGDGEANAKLLDEIDTLKKRCEMSDVMINELNRKASTAQLSLKERDEEMAKLNEEIDSLKTSLAEKNQLSAEDTAINSNEIEKLNIKIKESDDYIASLQEEVKAESEKLSKAQEELKDVLAKKDMAEDELASTRQTLKETEAELDQANDVIDQLTTSLKQFDESLGQVEQMKQRDEDRISDLKKRLDESETLVKSLKSTIEHNLHAQASSEAALRDEIERLRKKNNERAGTSRRRMAKHAPLDETLDDTEWLIGTPPDGTNARPFGMSDEEFGYREPKRRPVNDDPAQQVLDF